MNKISKFIVNHNILITVVCLLLLIPAVIGYINTRINYDILIYLPQTNETIKGQNILKEDFKVGSYAFVMVENESNKNILKLESKIKKIDGVSQVVSVADVLGTTIDKDMLPDEVLDKVYNKNETIIMVTFKTGTSEDTTINGLESLRELVDDSKVSSMTSMILDTRNIANQELVAYVVIAIILCAIVLIVATDSYVIPLFLLGNIGAAIIYNMGTNIFLGQISYITQAITAILQLGVTTDFSIFLYHKYEQTKKDNKKKSNKENMAIAIQETFKSVIGSSLTTFAGFLALCTMSFTLGADIGVVLAKGVAFGLICVMTLFPALILTFDKTIEKTKHKSFLPKFNKLSEFVVKHHKKVLIIFLILLIPAFYGYKNYEVYYKLDNSLPSYLGFHTANKELKEKFNIVSPEIIILDKDVKTNKVENLVEELKDIKGIDMVMAPSTYTNSTISELLDGDLKTLLNNDKYQLILINSKYEVATTKLDNQLEEVNKVVKKYDKNGIVAGEGALMNDLVDIAAHDFNSVTYTSLAVIFLIMVIVLTSIGLPIILVLAIEFAIFVNLACAYYTGTTLPFIASIIVGTIQLGATIDYAILMSNKYIEQRQITSDKNKAMTNTLKFTIPSIVTSAFCFFAATVGVSIYTKIDMIGSICTLLSRGAIVSMLVVIFILPALLLVFDKFIFKTTKIKGEVK